MTPSFQAVQSSHSITDFVFTYPQDAKSWYAESNTIVLLSVKNLEELLCVERDLIQQGLLHCAFREPDIDYELTAICLVPCEEVRKYCKKFTLAKLSSSSSISERSLREVPGGSPGGNAKLEKIDSVELDYEAKKVLYDNLWELYE